MGKKAKATVAGTVFTVEGFDVTFVGDDPDGAQYVDDYPFTKYAAYLSGNSEVRAADTWAAAHLPSVYYVETADLERVAPYVIHLSNVAQLALGARMAGASDLRFP
jgi:hypothetical protein